MFRIASLSLPIATAPRTVTMNRRGPTLQENLQPIVGYGLGQDDEPGAGDGPSRQSYELVISDLGSIIIRDTGDIHRGASWSVLINDQDYWFYEGEGAMAITVNGDGRVTISGTINTVSVSLLTPGKQPTGSPVQPQTFTQFMASVPNLASQVPGLLQALVTNNTSLLSDVKSRMPGTGSLLFGVSEPDDDTKRLINQLSNTPEMVQMRNVARSSNELALRTLQLGFSLGVEAGIAGWVSGGHVINLQVNVLGQVEHCLYVSAGYGIGMPSAALTVELGFNSTTIPETSGWSSVFGFEGGEIAVGGLSAVQQSGGQWCLSAAVGAGVGVLPFSGQGHYAYTWLSRTWLSGP